MRAIKYIHGNKPSHWIGDGFHVKTLISHFEDDPNFNYRHTDPFLLLDYAKPTSFEPNPHYESKPHGVGQHPHKGFETVTIAYAGEVSHADSAGGSATILAGDVQWMTAGRGVIHEEFHSSAFGKQGGVFSMVQLWINLPQANKLTEPNYQTLRRDALPIVDLLNENVGNDGEHFPIGKVAIIAGDFYGTVGAASTFTPINLWDIELQLTGSTIIEIPNSHNVLLLVQQGEVLINDTLVNAGKLIQFVAPIQSNVESQTTDTIKLTYPTTSNNSALEPVKVLLLSGEPIGEPIASYGPFVMTTQEELKQAFRDYRTGNFV